MSVALDWPDAARDAEIVLVLFIATVAYCVFHYGASAARFRDPELEADAREVRAWTLQRVSGFVLLGVVPACLAWALFDATPSDLGLVAGDLGLAVTLVGLQSAALLPLLYVASRAPAQQQALPQMRLERWDAGRFTRSAATWALYLVGYELFFRGFLLFALTRWAGAWPAIAISTALYTFAHLPKAAGETFGCIAMGVVFAASALATGAIWAPILVHCVIAISSERFAIAHNPEMRYEVRS